MEEDELLDLVNAHNEVVGTVMREEHHANTQHFNERGEYWRGVACFLINNKNEVWVPRRQPTRRVAPSGLDFSMAEHVQSGETHLEGAVRGMNEELNLVIRPEDLIEFNEQLAAGIGCIMKFYIYKTDITPDYSTNDYQSAQWVSLSSLEDLLKIPNEKFKSMLPHGVNKLREDLAV